MKIQLKVLFTVAAIICVISSYGYAFPITNTDSLTITSGDFRETSFGGGEFKLTNTSTGQSFTSFCVEVNEFISLGSTYQVQSVSTTAYNGGEDSSGDEISDAAQWLILKWLYDYSYLYANISGLSSTKNAATARQIQEAIWHFEDERRL